MNWAIWVGFGAAAIGGIASLFRTDHPDHIEPFQQELAPSLVFCELCRDWHPPENCAGEW